jgi:hypothetical protein
MANNSESIDGRRWNPWRIAGWSFATLILLPPLVAMQFTKEVTWTAFDFALAVTLILGVGIPFELAVRRTRNIAYRAGVGVELVAALFLVFINGAVGIIGSEDNPANLMYAGVLAVALIGALIARFQPNGMSRALFATAVAQALVGAIALGAGLGATAPSFPDVIIYLTAFFAAMWLLSAWLFRKAGREQAAVV